MGRLYLKRVASVATLLVLAALPVHAETVIVSAAASLTNAFTELGRMFAAQHKGVVVRFNFGSSGSLEQQIEQGAPVDVFASAAVKEMNHLQSEHLIVISTRNNFVTNRLVLIAPLGSPLKTWHELTARWVHHVAVSDPASVPSGRYAKETLLHKGIWSEVLRKAVLGENVRQTLQYVVDGDAQAGVVFATDAKIVPHKVKVVKVAVPGVDHHPIVYPVAVISATHHPLFAGLFVKFLNSQEAQAVLKHYGFLPPNVSVGKHASQR